MFESERAFLINIYSTYIFFNSFLNFPRKFIIPNELFCVTV